MLDSLTCQYLPFNIQPLHISGVFAHSEYQRYIILLVILLHVTYPGLVSTLAILLQLSEMKLLVNF